jgi:transcriptional regulator GlxA family with amidase domain
MTPHSPQRVGLLILPGFSMSAVSALVEPLQIANNNAGFPAFEWVTLSETDAPVCADTGMDVVPDLTLVSSPPLHYLFVLSAPTSRFGADKDAAALLRRYDQSGTSLGALGGGVFVLARAGLFSWQIVSVHVQYRAVFITEFPNVTISDTPYSIDGQRITATNNAAVRQLALRLIDTHLGPTAQDAVSQWNDPAAVHTPTPCPIDPNVPKVLRLALNLLHNQPHGGLRMAEVAAQVGLSARQLERLFQTHTDQSPRGYYTRLRIASARQMVQETNLPLAQIAQMFGYASLTQLAQAYQTNLNIDPQSDRDTANAARTNTNAPLPPH